MQTNICHRVIFKALLAVGYYFKYFLENEPELDQLPAVLQCSLRHARVAWGWCCGSARGCRSGG